MKSLREKIQRLSGAEGDDTSLWMFPYSNLMLILVILFVGFYSYSGLKTVEYEAALAQMESGGEAKKEVALAQNMKKFIEDSSMKGRASLEITASAISIKMDSPVIFDSGSADLRDESLPLLENLLAHLKDMGNVIVVEGHTDNVPINTPRFGSNWELSASRAFSVIGYFIGEGIEPARLVAHGFGEYRPMAPNDTEQGRAKNRRIEITILRGAGGKA